MAKFRLNSASVFTLGGNSFTCLVSADVSETVEKFLSNCAGQTYKEAVFGLQEATISVNGEIETDDVALINNFALKTNGALNFQPNGTTAGDIAITSTSATVEARTLGFSSNGLSPISVTLHLDDMTVAANSA
jgi:hypothetical protein